MKKSAKRTQKPVTADPFKRRYEWTAERIAALSTADIKQLRRNAELLNETAVVEMCSEALLDAVRRRRLHGAGSSSTKPVR